MTELNKHTKNASALKGSLAILLTLFTLVSCGQTAKKPQAADKYAQTTSSRPTEDTTNKPYTPAVTAPAVTEQQTIPMENGSPEIKSKCAVLKNITEGETLMEKNSHKRVTVASLTKVMTALLALEYKDEGVGAKYYVFSKTDGLLKKLSDENAATAGFEEGERVRLIDLVYAAMLPSGADGAYGIAALIADGDIDKFVDMMNQKARSLGMYETDFRDPAGLDDAGYSTAGDMAILLEAALSNSLFREVASSREWLTAPTEKHPNGIRLTSTVYAGLENNSVNNLAVKGGKTGYTEEAGLCLASFACHDGNEYILITLGAGDGSNKPQYQFTDAAAVYAFFGIE